MLERSGRLTGGGEREGRSRPDRLPVRPGRGPSLRAMEKVSFINFVELPAFAVVQCRAIPYLELDN